MIHSKNFKRVQKILRKKYQHQFVMNVIMLSLYILWNTCRLPHLQGGREGGGREGGGREGGRGEGGRGERGQERSGNRLRVLLLVHPGVDW